MVPVIVSLQGPGSSPATHTEPAKAPREAGGCGDHAGVMTEHLSTVATIRARLGVWPLLFF